VAELALATVDRHEVEAGAGDGNAASGIAGWLGLAAAPTFALMALWTALAGGGQDMPCMALPDAVPVNGMALMYLLMGIFHAAPWLKRLARRRQPRS